MFVLGNLLLAVATILDWVLGALLLIILINALLSWVRPDPRNPIVMFLDRVSDLVCDPIRRLFPTAVGGLDLAPLIAMLAIWFVQQFLVGTLRDIAIRMG
jgi:YggT family protein